MMMYQSQFIEMFGDCSNPKYPVYYLGDVCSVQRGGSPRPISEYITEDFDGLNWIKIGDADDSMFIAKTAEKIKPSGLKKTRQVYAGDLLLSNSMSFGRPYILKIDGCIHDGWLVLHFDQGKIDPIYLCCYLSQKRTYLEMAKLAAGGVVNNLNSEVVKKVPAIIPPISIQKQYVSIVEQADKSKFDGFKSQFIEQIESSNPDTFSIGQLLTQHRQTEYIKHPEREKLVTVSLYGKGVKARDMEKYDPKPFPAYRISAGQFIFSRIDARNGAFGIVPSELKGAVVSKDFPVFDINTTLVLPNVLLLSVLDNRFIHQIKLKSHGTTNRQRFKEEEFMEYKIRLPNIQIQNKIISFIEQADKSKSVCRQTIKRLAS